MLSVTVKITGLDNAQARLSKLGTSLLDFTGAFESLAKMLLLFYGDTVFGSRGQALGQTWAPLKDTTIAEKERNWPGTGMLVRSGIMQQSFYDEVTPMSLFISNRADYFPYHQLGTATGSGRGHNIPARPMIGVNTTIEGMIKTVIEADVRAKIDGATL